MTEIAMSTGQDRRQRTSSLDFISVWVIEDDQAYRETLVAAINESADVRCEHYFGDCESALALLPHDPPPVILMDIGMPKGRMNGIEATEKVKVLSAATDMIMLTIHGDDENVFKAIVAGASGYILKSPAGGFEEIVSAVKEVVLGSGSSMSPYIARKVLDMFTNLVKPKEDYALTGREIEVLQLLMQGMTKKEIADRLFRSFYTIDTHLKNIYAKLHVHGRAEAVAKALRGRVLK
jgi:DNA-binding NarL/FixJ family response regulator